MWQLEAVEFIVVEIGLLLWLENTEPTDVQAFFQ